MNDEHDDKDKKKEWKLVEYIKFEVQKSGEISN